MTTNDTSLIAGIIIGSALTGMIASLLWMQRRKLEAALPVNPDWPESDERPTADLLACQCAQCRSIRCADRRWLPESLVALPAGCRVSHGLCPKCERAMHAEIDALTPNAKLV